MSYIGKVEVNNSWAKLEDLIKAQVEGQSSFAFDSDTKYVLQCEGEYGARFCDVASKPSDDEDKEGFVIKDTQAAYYKPSDSKDLYTKCRYNSVVLVKIGILEG